MNANRFQNLTPRLLSQLLAIALGAVIALSGILTGRVIAADNGQDLVRKSCDNCGRTVSRAARRGQNCPHCGAFWAAERTLGMATPVDNRGSSASAPSAHARESMSLQPSSRNTWPTLPHRVEGRHQLVVDNHTPTDIWIGLRDGANGSDMKIPARGKGYVSLPQGTYRVYVFRADQPTSLYEARNIKMGGPRIIQSSQLFCLWFDEPTPVENIRLPKRLPSVAAR